MRPALAWLGVERDDSESSAPPRQAEQRSKRQKPQGVLSWCAGGGNRTIGPVPGLERGLAGHDFVSRGRNQHWFETVACSIHDAHLEGSVERLAIVDEPVMERAVALVPDHVAFGEL